MLILSLSSAFEEGELFALVTRREAKGFIKSSGLGGIIGQQYLLAAMLETNKDLLHQCGADPPALVVAVNQDVLDIEDGFAISNATDQPHDLFPVPGQ